MASLFVNNDHQIELRKLREASGALVASAVANATLYEADGTTEVVGSVWPLALIYTGARGTYKADMPSTVTLVAGKRYILKVTAAFQGRRYEEELVLRASKRRGTGDVDI